MGRHALDATPAVFNSARSYGRAKLRKMRPPTLRRPDVQPPTTVPRPNPQRPLRATAAAAPPQKSELGSSTNSAKSALQQHEQQGGSAKKSPTLAVFHRV